MENMFTLHPMLVRDSIELFDLPLCKVLLANDSQYPWFILVPRKAQITEVYQLDWQQQQQLLNESSMLSELLMQEFNGDKMNIAALGNMCPQLHVHHVVRFQSDIAWPAPIWGAKPTKPYNESELEVIKARVVPKLKALTAAE